MPIDRLQLLDWLLPHCKPGTASILDPKGSTAGPAWVRTSADVERAVAAYRAGSLPAKRFALIPQGGSREERQLAELRRKIERGTENLAWPSMPTS